MWLGSTGKDTSIHAWTRLAVKVRVSKELGNAFDLVKRYLARWQMYNTGTTAKQKCTLGGVVCFAFHL